MMDASIPSSSERCARIRSNTSSLFGAISARPRYQRARTRARPARPRRARPSHAGRLSAAPVRPTTSSSTAAARRARSRWRSRAGWSEPWQTTTRPRKPEQIGARDRLGVEPRRAARRAGRGSAVRPPSTACPERIADADRLDQRPGGALHQLDRDVAGEAVRDDDVSLACGEATTLDVPDELERRSVEAPQQRVRLGDDRRALLGLLADFESSPTRGCSTPITPRMNAAPMYANWTSCSARTSTVAPTSSSRTGRPGTGTQHGQRRPVDPGHPLHRQEPGRERRAGRSRGDQRSRAPVGDRRGRPHDRRVPLGRAPRQPAPRSWRSTSGESTTSTAPGGAPASSALERGRRPEHDAAGARGGGLAHAGGDLSGTEVGALGVYCDSCDGPASGEVRGVTTWRPP